MQRVVSTALDLIVARAYLIRLGPPLILLLLQVLCELTWWHLE